MNECERASELHLASGPRVPGEPRQGGGHQDGAVQPEDPQSSLTLMHLMQLFESAVTRSRFILHDGGHGQFYGRGLKDKSGLTSGLPAE